MRLTCRVRSLVNALRSREMRRRSSSSVNQRPHGPDTNSVAALVVHCCELTPFWLDHVGMGNPTDPTPECVVDKLKEAAVDPRNHRYSVSNGIAGVRREVAKKYKDKYGVELDPETEIISTIGSKEGFSHLCLAMLGPGDTIVVGDPAFPIMRKITQLPLPLTTKNGLNFPQKASAGQQAAGQPTVVLESGVGGWSKHWHAVQPAEQRLARQLGGAGSVLRDRLHDRDVERELHVLRTAQVALHAPREGLDPLVTMEVFTRHEAVLCGIDEAKNLLGHVLAAADPGEKAAAGTGSGDPVDRLAEPVASAASHSPPSRTRPALGAGARPSTAGLRAGRGC